MANQHTAKRATSDEIIEVLARHSRICDAAKELGVDESTLRRRLRAKGTMAGTWLGLAAKGSGQVLEGHRIRETTVRTDEAGLLVGTSIKTDRESDSPPKFEPVPEGHAIKGMSTYLGPQGEVRGQWVKTDQEKQKAWELFWSAAKGATERYRGIASRKVAPKVSDSKLLALYPLGDPHIGLLAWAPETGQNFDTRIAARELFGVVDMLVERTPRAHTGILANLGDFFHAEDDKQQTPASGHKLDVDGRSAKVDEIGFMLLRRMIDRLLERHRKVVVINVPGNHDPNLARMIALYLKAVYEDEPRVTILPNRNPFIYYRFGQNLIGFNHGQIKPERLIGAMITDRREEWGQTTHHFWHLGHIHTKVQFETPGCVIEHHRTLAANDSWALKDLGQAPFSEISMTNRRKKMTEIQEWVKLGRTSPVVPWNYATLTEAKRLGVALRAQAAERARFADRLPALLVEMEEAWKS